MGTFIILIFYVIANYIKKYYFCSADTRYQITQIINPLNLLKNGNKNQTTEKRS